MFATQMANAYLVTIHYLVFHGNLRHLEFYPSSLINGLAKVVFNY